jgi:hypothetical protein
MSDEELKAELERLRNENAALKKGASSGIRMKVSEKGALSIYGMGRFPGLHTQKMQNSNEKPTAGGTSRKWPQSSETFFEQPCVCLRPRPFRSSSWTRKHGSSLWPMHRGNDARLPEQRPVPRLARDDHAATHDALISGGWSFSWLSRQPP